MARNQSAGEPVGTPPEGGRWTWHGKWVRVDEAAPAATEPTAATAAPEPAAVIAANEEN